MATSMVADGATADPVGRKSPWDRDPTPPLALVITVVPKRGGKRPAVPVAPVAVRATAFDGSFGSATHTTVSRLPPGLAASLATPPAQCSPEVADCISDGADVDGDAVFVGLEALARFLGPVCGSPRPAAADGAAAAAVTVWGDRGVVTSDDRAQGGSPLDAVDMQPPPPRFSSAPPTATGDLSCAPATTATTPATPTVRSQQQPTDSTAGPMLIERGPNPVRDHRGLLAPSCHAAP